MTVSCLVSDLRFDWRLEPAAGGTRITVDVEIPEAEAHRLEGQREIISTSMFQLAELAASPAPPPAPGICRQTAR